MSYENDNGKGVDKLTLAEKKLFSSVGYFAAPSKSLVKFSSYKDFKKQ